MMLSLLPRKVSAAVFLFAFALLVSAAFSGEAIAKNTRGGWETFYECRTGWFLVREGSRYTYPSDGKFRPSWQTRCRKVTVRAQQ